MADPDWVNLPSVVLYDLYHFLSFEDRLAASSTCKKWRNAFLMFPNWRHLQLITMGKRREKNKFLAETGRKFCKKLTITFLPRSVTQLLEILQRLSSAQRLEDFQMVGLGVPYRKTLWPRLESKLYPMLEKYTELSSLFLSHVSNLDLLGKEVSKHSSKLTCLGVGRMVDTDKTDIPTLDLASFSLINLEVLHLDAMWITEELLIWISTHMPKLRRFCLVVRDASFVKESLDAWTDFNDNLPSCKIRLTYNEVQCVPLPSRKPSSHFVSTIRNVTHLRLIHCCAEFLINYLDNLVKPPMPNSCSLESVWAIGEKSQSPQPFVMCAWRLENLHEFYVCGVDFEDYDLVGMRRLRPALNIHLPKEYIQITPEIAELRGNRILPMDEKLIDLSIPREVRNAIILSTLASIDFKVNENVLKCNAPNGLVLSDQPFN